MYAEPRRKINSSGNNDCKPRWVEEEKGFIKKDGRRTDANNGEMIQSAGGVVRRSSPRYLLITGGTGYRLYLEGLSAAWMTRDYTQGGWTAARADRLRTRELMTDSQPCRFPPLAREPGAKGALGVRYVAPGVLVSLEVEHEAGQRGAGAGGLGFETTGSGVQSPMSAFYLQLPLSRLP